MSDRLSPAERTGQSVPRRHHYIPQMVQRHFAGADGQLWSFDKRHPERGVERKPIKRLFQVRHLYTIRRRDGTRDTTTETRLSAIESRAGPVLERVITDARAGRSTTFSQADRRALVDLLISQHRRSPDLHRGVLIRRSVESIIADSMAQWEALHGPPSAEERAFLASPEFIERARRDAMAEGAASPLETVTPAMLQRGFAVARIATQLRARERRQGAATAWHPKLQPTFSDGLVAVRRTIWRQEGLLTSPRSYNRKKSQFPLPPAWAYALCQAT